MRWIGLAFGLCLLFAGAAPRRGILDHQRPNDELAATNALAKLAVRRHDGARPLGTVGLDPLAPVSSGTSHEPRRTCVELVHATPASSWVDAHDSFDARGPPIA